MTGDKIDQAPSALGRRIVGVLSVAGGGVGVAATTIPLLNLNASLAELVFSAIFLVIYGYGIVVGAGVLERNDRYTSLALPYWLLQVFLIRSSMFSFQFSSGVHLYIQFADADLFATWSLGSFARMTFGSSEKFAAGINLVAIFCCWQLIVAGMRKRAESLGTG